MEKDQEVKCQVAGLVQSENLSGSNSQQKEPFLATMYRLPKVERSLLERSPPLTKVDDSLDALSTRIFFSTLDLVSGYWQVPLDQEAKEQSAFVMRGGLW